MEQTRVFGQEGDEPGDKGYQFAVQRLGLIKEHMTETKYKGLMVGHSGNHRGPNVHAAAAANGSLHDCGSEDVRRCANALQENLHEA